MDLPDSVTAAEPIRSLSNGRPGSFAPGELLDELREVMWRDVGPFRTAASLACAIARIREMRAALPNAAIPAGRQFNSTLAEWFEARGSLIAASAVAQAAAARAESRGAHQREDFPKTDPAWTHSQRVTMAGDGALHVEPA